MSKIEWSTINIKHAGKVKIIGDNGPIKIIIGGPLENGEYWWTIKVEEKGFASSIEEARQAALDSVRYDLEEAE
jgi:archaellum component FlaG (FlaF/FlaG flagellin family)